MKREKLAPLEIAIVEEQQFYSKFHYYVELSFPYKETIDDYDYTKFYIKALRDEFRRLGTRTQVPYWAKHYMFNRDVVDGVIKFRFKTTI